MKKLSLVLIFLLIFPTLSPAFNRNWAIAGGSSLVGACIGTGCYLIWHKNQSTNKPINKVHLALSTLFGGIGGLIGSHIFTHMLKTDATHETDVEKARKEAERIEEEELNKQHALRMQKLELERKKQQEENQKARKAQEDSRAEEDKKDNEMRQQQARAAEIEQQRLKELDKKKREAEINALLKAQNNAFDRKKHNNTFKEKLDVLLVEHDVKLKKNKNEADRICEAQQKANEEVIALADVPGFVDKSEEQQEAMYDEIYKKHGLK